MCLYPSQKPTSSKTRIKTVVTVRSSLMYCVTQKPTSSKTRIKTLAYKGGQYLFEMLRNQLPVKQGLRQSFCNLINFMLNSQKPTSSKTRIKTCP